MITRDEAVAQLGSGRAVALVRELSADLLTPVGALLRLLGAAERRGWRTVGLHAQNRRDRLEVALTVRGRGSADLLSRQLAHLQEVLTVSNPTEVTP